MNPTPRRVTLFAFWGRRPNVELQLPFIHRILKNHPQVEFHGWNLCRDPADDAYVQSVAGERIYIRNDFRGPRSYAKMFRVWQYYAMHSTFDERLFVKIDDDMVFIRTDRFGAFLDVVEEISQTEGGGIVSADVINNGACTPLHPQLWEQFEGLKIPLLDVHMSNAFAELAHQYMFDHWFDLVAQPLQVIPSDEWCSINMIGMDWRTLCRLSQKVGKRSPPMIANREWNPRTLIGDEGAANLLPRYLLKGMTAGHLGFGPQKLIPEQEDRFRQGYAVIADQYLAGKSRELSH